MASRTTVSPEATTKKQMTSTDDKASNGIPNWAAPWAPGWSGMHDQGNTLPKKSQRRIQRIGLAATSVAATIWLLGAAWLWQVIA